MVGFKYNIIRNLTMKYDRDTSMLASQKKVVCSIGMTQKNRQKLDEYDINRSEFLNMILDAVPESWLKMYEKDPDWFISYMKVNLGPDLKGFELRGPQSKSK